MREKKETKNNDNSYHREDVSSNNMKTMTNHPDPSINRMPCVKCGKLPTKENHDACLGTLPGVIDACCGHGVTEAYINFENGLTLRGSLVIEFVQANLKNKYK
jgi:hypothetical protein